MFFSLTRLCPITDSYLSLDKSVLNYREDAEIVFNQAGDCIVTSPAAPTPPPPRREHPGMEKRTKAKRSRKVTTARPSVGDASLECECYVQDGLDFFVTHPL